MRAKELSSWVLVGCMVLACGTENKDPLPSDQGRVVQELRMKLQDAKDRRDVSESARLQHLINHHTELLAAGHDVIEIQRVNRKYEILNQVLNDEIREFEDKEDNTDAFSDLREALSGSQKLDMKDEVYQGPDFVGAYDSRVLDEVKRVFKDYGPLYINITKDAKGGNGYNVVAAERRPWSGFWYPFGNNASLYKGENSPLGKFDALMKKRKIESRSAEVEKERYRGFRPDAWEGLCDALAAASIMTSEPLETKIIDGISFSPGDQKALFTFSHLKYPRTIYGRTYLGNAETDGTYQDIKPEAFHLLITKILGEEKRAVIIDDVAGIQVWNKPLFNYRWKIEQDKKYDFAFEVKAYALLMKERSKETDEPTSNQDILAPTYTSRLYVDKKDMKEGKFRVIAGQWIGESFRDHPDTVSYLHKTGDPLSHNAEFNKNISNFKALFMNPSSPVR